MPRSPIAAATVLAATLALSGCSFLAPTRDTEGGIVGEVKMPSTDAWVGDCFTFLDGSTLAYATVVPCTEPHTHLVIGTGRLTDERIARFDSLQDAIIGVCEVRLEIYQSYREDEVAPEYIASRRTERDGRELTHYSCLVKDS